MKFLLDENADARLAEYLRSTDHDVTRLSTDYPAGLPDEEVLDIANTEGRILITNDSDFGERVFRLGELHAGVILFRLGPYAPLGTKIERLDYVLTQLVDDLNGFIVVRKYDVRVRNGPSQT